MRRWDYSLSTVAAPGRNENQDAILADEQVFQGARRSWTEYATSQAVYAVADGVAITPRAAEASAALLRLMGQVPPATYWRQPRLTMEAISDKLASDHGCRGGAATLAVAVIDTRNVLVINAGDSRVYRLRGDVLELLSRDHKQAQEALDTGEIEADDLPDLSPAWHGPVETFRAVPGEPPNVYIAQASLEPGDWLLLCTDGLTNALGHDALTGRLLAALGNAERLVDEARRAGGDDDISALLVQIPGVT